MKKLRTAAVLAFLALPAVPAVYAQHGCFRSPEAPTDVLMLVGGAGMFYGSSVLHRWMQRRRKRR